MTIEDRVRAGLQQKSTDVEASEQAWERIQRRIDRRPTAHERWAALAVGLLAAAAGLGLVGWMLLGSHGSHGSNRAGSTARSGGTAPPTRASASPSPEQRYEATGIVIQQRGGPVMLCLGAIDLSLPPSCGTMPITNWDWARVKGEERLLGVTWGSYHVVGTYDGTSFTLTDVGPPRPSEGPSDQIVIPCPEPEGGWVASDPSRTTELDRRAAGDLAAGQPDSAGWWVKIIHQPGSADVYGPNDVVLNAAFTGDIERHRRELARVWGGPLCVVQYQRTEAELLRIQGELTSRGAEAFGVQVLSSNADVVHNRVEVGVVVSDEQIQTAIDERYGEGAVQLLPELHPVG
jgi:hypothetical protein